MSGKLAVSESGLKLRAKNRSDELLETSVENGGKSAGINISTKQSQNLRGC